MVMATFERTREFGMLLALGTRPARLIRLVVAESMALGVVGAVMGSLIGIALVAITHRTGIDYSWLAGGGPSELSFAGLRFSLRFYPTLSVVDVARAIAAVCVTSLLAATWPALRASRLQPVKALRGVRWGQPGPTRFGVSGAMPAGQRCRSWASASVARWRCSWKA
jgi:ABC-type lipoprotein release transport system permease subunit